MKINNNRIKNLVLAAFFAAMIFLATAYILHIPTTNGYTHIGDALIYLAASILPTPYAMAAGALGAALSDGLTGYAIWIIPSVIIKALTAAMFTAKNDRIVCKRNILAFIPSLIFCAGGYYLAEAIMLKNFVSPLASIPGSFFQVGTSIVVYLIIGYALDKANFKKIYYR